MKRLIATAVILLTPALACAHEHQGKTDGSNNQGQTQSQPATNNQNQANNNNANNNNNASNDKSMLQMPKDAKVIATAEADELHIFPELPRSQKNAGNKQGANNNQGQGQAQTQPQQVEEVAKVRALDTVYSTNKSYQDTVKFFDSQAKQNGMTQLQRTVTQTATGWTFKLSNGRAQDVIVRNTNPTTIETVQASESESPLH